VVYKKEYLFVSTISIIGFFFNSEAVLTGFFKQKHKIRNQNFFIQYQNLYLSKFSRGALLGHSLQSAGCGYQLKNRLRSNPEPPSPLKGE